MNDSFPQIFSLSITKGDVSCSSQSLEWIFKSVSIPKLNQKQIDFYIQKRKENTPCGEAAYLSGFNFPFMPKILKHIGTIVFDDNDFLSFFVLNSFVSWVIYFEKIKSTEHVELLLSSILKTFILTKSELCVNAFIHMYQILLDSNIYTFEHEFFKMVNTLVQKNPSKSNIFLNLLARSKSHIDLSNAQSINSLLKTIINATKSKEAKIEIGTANIIMKTFQKEIIEMKKDALHILDIFTSYTTPDTNIDIFQEIPQTIIQIIIKENESNTPTNEEPKCQNSDLVIIDDSKFDEDLIDVDLPAHVQQQKLIINMNTTNSTFKDFDNIDLTVKQINNPRDFANFCSNETLEKLMIFLPTTAKQLLFSTVFMNAFYREIDQYTNNLAFPHILSALVFCARNIQGLLTNSLFAPLLAKSPIFDCSKTIFDLPDSSYLLKANADQIEVPVTCIAEISKLRQEIIILSLNEGYTSFNEVLESFRLYPNMLAEIFYRLCDTSDLFHILIKHNVKSIKTLINSLLFYTKIDGNDHYKDNIFEIERTRVAQLSFLNLILSKLPIAEMLYQDSDFVTVFISFIFENKLRKFVLDKLLFFLTEGTISGLNYTIGPLVTIFAQNDTSQFFNKDFCDLIKDTIEMLITTHKNRKGLSDIIGPIHESLNLLIHNMPPTEDTEKILFLCINLFTEAGNENMLTQNSMQMLSDSIINFYDGKPTKDLYLRLLKLFIGDSQANEATTNFEIKQKMVLPLLFAVFVRSELSQSLLEFLSNLFVYSPKNCAIGHECALDLLIIDLLIDMKHKENANESNDESSDTIVSLLHLLVQIASVSSSTRVVSKYMYLLSPLENGSLSKFNSLFLDTLYKIIYNNYLNADRTISLQSTPKNYMKSSIIDPSKKYTFVFWFSTHNFTQASSDFLQFTIFNLRIIFSIHHNILYFKIQNIDKQHQKSEQDSDLRQIGILYKTIWSFITLSIVCNNQKNPEATEFELSFNLLKPIRIKQHVELSKNKQEQQSVQIKTFLQQELNAEISYIALFERLQDKNINDLLKFGPYLNYIDYLIQKHENDLNSNLELEQNPEYNAIFEQIPNYQQLTKKKVYIDQKQIHKSINSHSFGGYLCKKLSFKPFMRNINLINQYPNNDDIILYIGVLTKCLSASDEGQVYFDDNKYTEVIAYILMNSTSSQLTYQLYLSFFSLFISINKKSIKDKLFKLILSNPMLWSKANKDEHENIIKHWSKVLYPSYLPNAADLRSFSSLLNLLTIYYWPKSKPTSLGENVEENIQNISDAGVETHEINSIDYFTCRSLFLIILKKVAEVKFTSEDFVRLLAQCYLCDDEYLSSYLMIVINTILMELPNTVKSIKIPPETISILQLLLNKKTDDISYDIIQIIAHIHKLGVIDNNLLSLHLDAIMVPLQQEYFNISFFTRIISKMKEDTPELLNFCCWYISSSIKPQEDIQELIKALKSGFHISQSQIVYDPMSLYWPCILAVKKPIIRNTLFSFLFKELHENWFIIIPNLYIASRILKIVDFFEVLKDFVIFLISGDVITQDNINGIITIVVWYLTTKEFYTISPYIEQIAETEMKNSNSIIGSLQIDDNQKSAKVEKSHISEINPTFTELAQEISNRPNFKFGLRIENGNWYDFEIANAFVLNIITLKVFPTDVFYDKFIWLLYTVGKFSSETAINHINSLFETKIQNPMLTLLNQNLNSCTNYGFYKRINDSLYRNTVSYNVEKCFEDVYSRLSDGTKEFFNVLLPKFSNGVMEITDIFKNEVESEKKEQKNEQLLCFEAYNALFS